jgi:predicted nucleic acid-binding protein
MMLPKSEHRTLVERLAGLSISGGAVYDAVVACTADHHGCRLLSCDRRAAKTYDRLGIEVVYL